MDRVQTPKPMPIELNTARAAVALLCAASVIALVAKAGLERRRRLAFEELSRMLGLTPVATRRSLLGDLFGGRPGCRGIFLGRPLSVVTTRDVSLRNPIRVTRIEIPADEDLPELLVRRRSRLISALSDRAVKTGDPDFDAVLDVFSPDPEFALLLLDAAIRGQLSHNARRGLFKGTCGVNSGRIYYEESGFLLRGAMEDRFSCAAPVLAALATSAEKLSRADEK